MAKIGFIGMGNMGQAMMKGCLKSFDREDIIFAEKFKENAEKVSAQTGIEYVASNAECVNRVKYVVLAVKPQQFSDVYKSIENVVTADHIVISIAPGISIKQIQDNLGFDLRVVRAMPNTPALVGEGMTGIAYDESLFNSDEIEIIKNIFKAIGKFKKVPEKLMSAVTCASGSSPAYVYMFIEALADGAVRCGMPRKDAYEFVAQTVLGSAKMVLETGKHPGELKDMVCSPAGTTIAAVKELEDAGFRSALMKATDACYEKCENM